MKDTHSEDWRMACEARHIVNLAGLRLRRDYLDLVEVRRGKEARDALEAAVVVQWSLVKGKRDKGQI